MVLEQSSDTIEKIANTLYKLYNNEKEFIELLQQVYSLDKDATLYLIGKYTIKAYENKYNDVPSEIFKIINEYLRKEPSFFLYTTKYILRKLEGKEEDAKEILKVMYKKYKHRSGDIKELEKLSF